jgi:two-component system CheB/CheR fusion protein
MRRQRPSGGGLAQREADRLLLARFAPASLLIDDALNILQFRGETGPYLEHASGPPSLHLSRVARPELMVEIDPAIREARESGVEARRQGLSVGDLRNGSIELIPLPRMSAERCYLILFEDGSPRRAAAARIRKARARCRNRRRIVASLNQRARSPPSATTYRRSRKSTKR